MQTRGGKGILTQKTTGKTGPLVAVKSVLEDDQLMIATEAGTMIRMAVRDISVYSRNTQGVRVINLKANDAIADVARVVIDGDDDAAVEQIDPTPTGNALATDPTVHDDPADGGQDGEA